MPDQRYDSDYVAEETGWHQITTDIDRSCFAVILADKRNRHCLPLTGHLFQSDLRAAVFDQRLTPSEIGTLAFQQSDKSRRAKHRKGAYRARGLDNAEVRNADFGVEIGVSIKKSGLENQITRPDGVGHTKSFQGAAAIVRGHDQLSRTVLVINIPD